MLIKHPRISKGFTLVELLVVVALVAGLAAISSPIILKQIAKSRATHALNNAKDIYIGLRNYNLKFGTLPAALSDSNTSLIPVITARQIRHEKPFYVKGVSSYGVEFKEGDGNITAGNALDSLENVFSYWGESATKGVDIVKASANTPILTVPQSATATAIESATFYTADFGGQGVILSVDGAAAAYPILTGASTAEGTLNQQDGSSPINPALNVSTGTPATLVSVLPKTS